MTRLMIAMFLTGTITLSLGNYDDDPVVLEHDPDERAACVQQLLAHDGEPHTFASIVGTLNYTDKQYGGPCAALTHLELHGWY